MECTSCRGGSIYAVGDDLKVLAIEDDESMRRLLRRALATQGFKLIAAATGTNGLQLAARHSPDLVLLDLGLPDVDGLDLMYRLRWCTQAPIIILSACDREKDKVQALDAGAADYLTKPFGVRELLARVRAAIRHTNLRAFRLGTAEGVLAAGPLRVDVNGHRVLMQGREVRLTPIERNLLLALLHHSGNVVTHRQLLSAVWGPDRADETQYLHVYMGHLRRKLEADPGRPQLLITEPGVGYRINAE
jgi:two-component system KDP operon response regulator KdpE